MTTSNQNIEVNQIAIEMPVECEAPNNALVKESSFTSNIKYLLVGVFFGIVFVKGEVISWYRIQEMFRLHSFHMYGVIGTAVAVGALSVWVIKKFQIRTMQGETVVFTDRKFNWGQVIGGTMFGLGWAVTGACPGPLFAQMGSGFLVIIVTFMSALAGTWVDGLVRERLPH